MQDVKKIAVSPSILRREELIRNDLSEMKLDKHTPEAFDLLIHHLAYTQTVSTAERVYRTIFGSQIATLKILNTSGTRSREHLKQIYGVAMANFPQLYQNYSFQDWLKFLLSQGLLGTNDQETFFITDDGKEFLKWITEAGVNENKPF